MDGKTVSEMMRAILKYRRRRARRHPLELYAEILSELPFRVSRFLHAGHRSVVMRLVDGTILKVTGQPDLPRLRPCDIPRLAEGTATGQNCVINWFVQPAAETPIRREDFMPFLRRIGDDGYRMIDPGYHNLGYYQSSTVLIDPFAVVELPEDMKWS
jgi:hypothetical protein